jgi:hypothetical protein
MTAVATIIFLVTTFSSGAWVVVIAIPGLILLFSRISRYYTEVGKEMGVGSIPDKPNIHRGLVLVAVNAVSRMTEASLSTALSLNDEVIAVSVQFDGERAAALQEEWDRWDPGIELVILHATTRSIAAPMLDYLGSPAIRAHGRILVLIPEVEPRKLRHRLLQNQRDVILANVLRRRIDVSVARVPFRLYRD